MCRATLRHRPHLIVEGQIWVCLGGSTWGAILTKIAILKNYVLLWFSWLLRRGDLGENCDFGPILTKTATFKNGYLSWWATWCILCMGHESTEEYPFSNPKKIRSHARIFCQPSTCSIFVQGRSYWKCWFVRRRKSAYYASKRLFKPNQYLSLIGWKNFRS